MQKAKNTVQFITKKKALSKSRPKKTITEIRKIRTTAGRRETGKDVQADLKVLVFYFLMTL
ncbi:MAG: hypothetical protein IPP52_15125 [Ignavibacteria bacterium]|nr:hypothetical protein [Ignavibacteria bacterium]